MSFEHPTVSVCLPVYNGEGFLPEAIQSILEQTFGDLELIVSDNASTDRTGAICKEFSARDRRVRYFRAEVNGGLAWNFNRAFELARGRYLMWLGHDDIIAPDYIERCAKVLEEDARAVLCLSYQRHIDETGNLVNYVELQNDAGAEIPSDRFKRIIDLDHWCDAIFGLMRTDALRQTRLHGGFADSDRVLLCEMGLLGRFRLIPDYLFSRRVHSQGTTWQYDPWERTMVFDPSRAGKPVFPFIEKTVGFLSAIGRARLPWIDRVRCYQHFAKWLVKNRRLLWEDFVGGSRMARKYRLSKRVQSLIPEAQSS